VIPPSPEVLRNLGDVALRDVGCIGGRGMGGWLGWMIQEVFSNLIYSVILRTRVLYKLVPGGPSHRLVGCGVGGWKVDASC